MIDLTGQQFGALRPIRFIPYKEHRVVKRAFWLCECRCGRLLLVRADNLRYGISTQCSICRNDPAHRSRFVKEVTADGQLIYP